jgi:predicted DsbA family dithiol-disulfide isomerase
VIIEVFSDVVCPWCALGKRRLEGALTGFAHADDVEVVWRSYELDPRAPAVRDGDNTARLAEKYGITREQAEAAHAGLVELAAAEGLEFDFSCVRPGNTFDAHRLLHAARRVGLQDALKERLFTAYFSEGEAIGNREVLVRLAVEVGMDEDAARGVLETDRFADEVRADEQEAAALGVTGVPFFVVDGRFAIPGAQDTDTFRRVLERAWALGHPVDA